MNKSQLLQEDEMFVTPNGYRFGNVDGKTLRHLVKCEVYNSRALCGVDVYFDSLTEVSSVDRKICPKCLALAEPVRNQ